MSAVALPRPPQRDPMVALPNKTSLTAEALKAINLSLSEGPKNLLAPPKAIDVENAYGDKNQLYKTPSIDSATTLVEPSNNLKTPVSCDQSTPSLYSSATTLDDDASSKSPKADKASAKAAKRKARRELNKAKRKAEARATEMLPKAAQPWESALADIGNSPPSPFQSSSSTPLHVPSKQWKGKTIPTRTYDVTDAAAVAVVERLVAMHGAWSITFSDPSYRIFITPDLGVAISFKIVKSLLRRVAVVFGDPVCHSARLPSAIAEFHAFCRRERYRLAFVAARKSVASVAHIHGWASIEFAVEQMVDPQTNPVLDGTRGKRQALLVKKLAKEAPVREYSPADGNRDPELEGKLQAVYEAVYSSKEERDGAPYSTKLQLFALPKVMSFLYTTDSDGEPNGLVGLMHVGEKRYLLDPLVALSTAPTGTTDYLSVLAIGYLRRRGATHMSFGTEPTETVGEVRGMRQFMETDTRNIHAATYEAFGFAGKKILHDKFHPDAERKERLYLVLAARGMTMQSVSAMAIWQATHLKSRPVVKPLVNLVRQQRAGAQLEQLLVELEHSDRLLRSASGASSHSSGSKTGTVTTATESEVTSEETLSSSSSSHTQTTPLSPGMEIAGNRHDYTSREFDVGNGASAHTHRE